MGRGHRQRRERRAEHPGRLRQDDLAPVRGVDHAQRRVRSGPGPGRTAGRRRCGGTAYSRELSRRPAVVHVPGARPVAPVAARRRPAPARGGRTAVGRARAVERVHPAVGRSAQPGRGGRCGGGRPGRSGVECRQVGGDVGPSARHGGVGSGQSPCGARTRPAHRRRQRPVAPRAELLDHRTGGEAARLREDHRPRPRSAGRSGRRDGAVRGIGRGPADRGHARRG